MWYYRIVWLIMVLSFTYISTQGTDLRFKLVGLLLAIVNGILFWK